MIIMMRVCVSVCVWWGFFSYLKYLFSFVQLHELRCLACIGIMKIQVFSHFNGMMLSDDKQWKCSMSLCRTIDIGFCYKFSQNEDNHDVVFFSLFNFKGRWESTKVLNFVPTIYSHECSSTQIISTIKSLMVWIAHTSFFLCFSKQKHIFHKYVTKSWRW